jgi:hypothetical protein
MASGAEITVTDLPEVRRLVQAVHALLLARLVSREAGAPLPVELWNELISAHDALYAARERHGHP